MEAEYELQHASGDHFWGIDKERRHMLADLEIMSREDQLSKTQEQDHKAMEVRQEWDRENQNILKEKAMIQAMEEQDRRQQYMRAFFHSTSSAPVMDKTWLPNSHQENVDILNMTKRERELIKSKQLDHSLRIPKFGATKTLFHEEGLQQARTLAPEGSSVEAFGEGTEKLMASTTNIEGSTTSMYANGFEIGRDELMEGQRMIKLAEEVMHGHAIYQWDQEALLREAFVVLDTQHNGFLTPEVVSNIARNEAVKGILRFTVLGVFIKLRVKGDVAQKGWRLLLKYLFDLDENSGPASSPPLTLPKLMEITRQLSFEKAKPLRLIKTHDEYFAELSSTRDNSVFFAEQMRQNRTVSERDLALYDQLHVGDTIWTLYKDGSQWQPAIIEAVNENYTYDIRYPMTQDELRSARKVSADNRILRKGRGVEQRKSDPAELLKVNLLRNQHPSAVRVTEKALASGDKGLMKSVNEILMFNSTTYTTKDKYAQ